MMKVEEFVAAVAAGTAKHSDIIRHHEQGHFTPAEYEAYHKAQDGPAWCAREDAFYRGKLFKAQNCLFDEWCDGVDAKQDRRRAEEYLNLEKSTGNFNAEIQLFIRLMVQPRRVPAKELEKEPDTRAGISTKWISNIDKHQWRHWPKIKNLENFQFTTPPAGARR